MLKQKPYDKTEESTGQTLGLPAANYASGANLEFANLLVSPKRSF
jgi:hypothetical protein